MKIYETIKAKSAEEAVSRSELKVGDKLVVTELKATANSDGSWYVVPVLEKVDAKEN